jgi:hypothetical protein
LPAIYADLLRKAQEAQDAEDADAAEVDFFFEVPLQLAHRIAGFKHDEEIAGINYEAFHVYDSQSGTPGRKWWQVWR